jgi:hypothetical protein
MTYNMINMGWKPQFRVKKQVQPGETWFYKRPRESHLTRGWVSDITGNTVEVRNSEWSTSSVRYSLEDVEFVEQVKNPVRENEPYPGSVTLAEYIRKVEVYETK